VKVLPKAEGARNYTQCDSMLIGNACGAHTFPYIEVANNTATLEHEASTLEDRRGPDLLPARQRGLNAEHAVSMIVNGVLQGSVQGAADGVRAGSAAAPRDLARRQRRMTLG
jgi:Fe-S cluster assembly scaffold protein SufB